MHDVESVLFGLVAGEEIEASDDARVSTYMDIGV
jgi:hypothetical protein